MINVMLDRFRDSLSRLGNPLTCVLHLELLLLLFMDFLHAALFVLQGFVPFPVLITWAHFIGS
jgi:hypothetical protein